MTARVVHILDEHLLNGSRAENETEGGTLDGHWSPFSAQLSGVSSGHSEHFYRYAGQTRPKCSVHHLVIFGGRFVQKQEDHVAADLLKPPFLLVSKNMLPAALMSPGGCALPGRERCHMLSLLPPLLKAVCQSQ